MPKRTTTDAGQPTLLEAAADDQVSRLSTALRQEQDTNLLLQESLAQVELALEDAGWHRLTDGSALQFSRGGIGRAAEVCRVMAVVNPLIKRGLALRVGYVWGGGVSISARASGRDGEQDVNGVVQAFLDDRKNRRAFTGGQAREEAERVLGTDGNLFLALFTSPRTGRVQVRSIPFDEVTNVLCNPDDRDDPWYYERTWTQETLDPAGGGVRTESRRAYYPALGYYPRGGDKLKSIGGEPVQWDTPVAHVRVNALDGWDWGVPDAYASVWWGRAYKEFLEDWAKLVKALSRFAWRATTPANRSKKVRDAIAAAPTRDTRTGEPEHAGATAVMSPGTSLEAIPKTGATINSESGRPLAAMVAAGLDVPVTMLLGDPGTTGARAVAETLDEPTRNAMSLRRELWSEVYRDVLDYVIDQAVIAPSGPLKGTVTRDDDGQRLVTLRGDSDGSMRTIEITWPEWENIAVDLLVKAIQVADQTGKVPPLVVARLLLEALGVEDVDELVDSMTDDDGNFIDPDVNAGQAAADAFRRGEDPNAPLNGPSDQAGGTGPANAGQPEIGQGNAAPDGNGQ
ncbi:MAG: hypothetical protein J2P24_00415 [Streptosporangiales bacterium]|nr:hypothetical protein [Streptosporangiales bacterium]